MYVYDADTFTLKKLIAGHDKVITCLVWNPNSPTMFATGSFNGEVNVWDLANSTSGEIMPNASLGRRGSSGSAATATTNAGGGDNAPSLTTDRAEEQSSNSSTSSSSSGGGGLLPLPSDNDARHAPVNTNPDCLVCRFVLPSPILALDWDPATTRSSSSSSSLAAAAGASRLVVSTQSSSVFICDVVPQSSAGGGGGGPKSSNPPSSSSSSSYSNSEILFTNIRDSQPARANVVRWHPNDTKYIAFGNTDGSIRIQDLTTKKGSKDESSKVPPAEKGVAIADMRWDRLSNTYMLSANERGCIQLVDIATHKPIRSFEKETSGVSAISWMEWEPGNFATVNNRTGVLKVWNVSQPRPIAHHRIGAEGFQSFAILPGKRALCSFADGSVTLYNLHKRLREFASKPGHTETVFACDFNPASGGNVLATSSYDSTVKIWKTSTMELDKTLVGQKGVIFSMSWSRCGRMLASSSITGQVYIWDVATGLPIVRLGHHNDAAYCVDWSHRASQLLLSVSGDRTAVVFDETGNIHRRFRLPAGVFGCQWCPHNSDVFAVGCKDSNAYIFDNSQSGKAALKHILVGHSMRCFHARWSPLLPGTLATGSDDKTLRIWKLPSSSGADGDVTVANNRSNGTSGRSPKMDYVDLDVDSNTPNTERDKVVSSTNTLIGHTLYVRPVVWHSEVPFLIISGGWDSTIRLWDIRKEGREACIAIGSGHLADVYGLAAHPKRPFVFATTSRDSTVRFWNIGGVTEAMAFAALKNNSLSRYLSTAASCMSSPSAKTVLSGLESKYLDDVLRKSSPEQADFCQKVFNFFGGMTGIDDLWQAATIALASTSKKANSPSSSPVMKGDEESLVPRHVMHKDEVVGFFRNEAALLESIKMRRAALGGGIGGMKKDEQIRKAAEGYAQCGDLRKYCDILVELGEWERALSVAPGVSMAYWRDLAKQHARNLAKEMSEESVPVFAAAGIVDEAVGFYMKRMQLKQAFLVAAAANEGLFPAGDDREGAGGAAGGDGKHADKDDIVTATPALKVGSRRSLLHLTTTQMAQHYVSIGEPILAATSLLAANNVAAAIDTLLDADIFILAFAVAKCAGISDDRLIRAEATFLSNGLNGYPTDDDGPFVKDKSKNRRGDEKGGDDDDEEEKC